MDKKIAIFGANGNIGHQAVEAFGKAGWQVRAVTRQGDYRFGSSVETRSADAMERIQLIEASKGCDFIFNAINVPYPQWNEKCMPISRNVLAAAKAHGAVHLFPANIYNFGTKIPPLITDETPFDGDTKKGRIRIEMEKLFAHSATGDGVQTIAIRACDFFGGRSKGTSWFDLVICKSLAKGKLIYPGPLDIDHTWHYLPDLAGAFVKISEQAANLRNFEVFNMDGHTLSATQLKNALENIIGRPLKTGGVPWPLLKMASLFSPMLREVCEMSYLWHAPHKMDGSRLAERIGADTSTPLELALSQALIDQNLEFLVNRDQTALLFADVA